MCHLEDIIDGAHGRGSPGAHNGKNASRRYLRFHGAWEIVSFEVSLNVKCSRKGVLLITRQLSRCLHGMLLYGSTMVGTLIHIFWILSIDVLVSKWLWYNVPLNMGWLTYNLESGKTKFVKLSFQPCHLIFWHIYPSIKGYQVQPIALTSSTWAKVHAFTYSLRMWIFLE